MPALILDNVDDLGPEQPVQERLDLDWHLSAAANWRATGQHLVQAWMAGVEPEFVLMSPAEIHQNALASVDLDEQLALIGSQLAVAFGGTDESRQRMMKEVGRFAERLHLQGVISVAEINEQHVHDFINEAVPRLQGHGYKLAATGTMHLRRTAIRLVIRTARQLHLVGSGFDPTIDIVLPPRGTYANRPLTDDEELQGRLAATGSAIHTRRPAAWALGQATAVAGELRKAVVADLDLSGQRVRLRGTQHRKPRLANLTDWGVEQLAERVEHLQAAGHGDDAPLIRSPGSSPRSGQTQSCNALSETLALAQLAGEPDISPMSLANWRGRKVFDETGDIDQAAKTLGLRSLDTTAWAIGWDWQ